MDKYMCTLQGESLLFNYYLSKTTQNMWRVCEISLQNSLIRLIVSDAHGLLDTRMSISDQVLHSNNNVSEARRVQRYPCRSQSLHCQSEA